MPGREPQVRPGRHLGSAALLGALLLGSAGSTSGCAGPQEASTPPTAEHAARLSSLHASIEQEVKGLTALFAPLPGRVEQLATVPPEVAPVDLDPDIVRGGFAACFGAPGQGPCQAPAVVTLLDWANTTGDPIKTLVTKKVADLSFLRTALAIVMERSTGVLNRMHQARLTAERIVGEAYVTLEKVQENPLEAARVKDASRDEFAKLMKTRTALDKLAGRVDADVRPLADHALVLHQKVTASIARFGDVQAPTTP